jgi:hypothetical protein
MKVSLHKALFSVHQQKFDLKWTMCVLRVMRVCMPKQTISSTFLKRKTPILTAEHWTKNFQVNPDV